MNPLNPLKNLILALHGGGQPRHLAAGVAFGAALGLIPKGNLIAAILVAVFIFFRVDKSMAMLSAAAFTPIGYALDSQAHRVGLALLHAPALQGFWTALYEAPIIPWTRFNNSVVLGNLVFGFFASVPLYFLCLRAIASYNARLAPRVERLRLVQAIKGAQWYQKYQEWLS